MRLTFCEVNKSQNRIRPMNQYNSRSAWQTSRKTFKTQNQSNQLVQLTSCMADKQKDIQNTKSEQSTSTTHDLHSRQAERHSEHKMSAINQYNSRPAWQTSRKTFRRTQNQSNQPVQCKGLEAYEGGILGIWDNKGSRRGCLKITNHNVILTHSTYITR